MASKTIYYCDICGDESERSGSIRIKNTEGEMDCFDDVCVICFKRVTRLIEDMTIQASEAR